MIKLPCKISISRISNSHGPDTVEIRVQDPRAHAIAVEIEMSPEAYGNAISGLSFQDGVMEFNDCGVVGTTGENKTEVILVRDTEPHSVGEDEALALYQVEGWRARTSDITNSRRKTRGPKGSHYQSVVFFRNVPLVSKPEDHA